MSPPTGPRFVLLTAAAFVLLAFVVSLFEAWRRRR